MRIVAANIYQVVIPFRFSFKHALAERRRADSVLFNLQLENGVDGWGEAAPRAYLTGETTESVIADLREWITGIRSQDFPLTNPLAQLYPLYECADATHKNSAYAALEIALIDALARSAKISAQKMLALPPKKTVPLTAPLGSADGTKLKILTHLFYYLGFRDFKLKIGVAHNRDLDRVKIVKKIIGERGDLRVDTNAAWDLATALKIIPHLAPFVSVVEQPTAAIADFPLLKKVFTGQLMADESLCARRDAEILNEIGGCHFWNLRLGKIGGFNGLFSLLKIGEKSGVKFHLGALVGETALLTNAGRIAAAAAGFSFVEYGFPRLLLKDDPFRGGVAGYFGVGAPVQEATLGFGTRLLPEILRKITVRHEHL